MENSINDTLDNASELIKKAIRLSLEDIRGDRRKEQEYIDLWVKYGMKISGFINSEAERTGNQRIIGNIKKSLLKSTKLFGLLPIPKF